MASFSCVSRSKKYEFFDDNVDYNTALSNCESRQPRTKIAKFLNDRIYNQFLTCCTNHKSYWIGFRQDLSHCSNGTKRFRWEKKQNCHSKPSYIRQQQNNDGCMAVFIELRKPNSTNVIQATLANCSQRFGYICQRNNSMTNQTALNNSRLDRAFSACKTLNQKTSDYPLLKETNFNGYKDIAIGGSIALIILVILFGFVYKCYSKKSNSAKAKTNANSLSKQQMKSSNTAETTHDFSPSNYALQFFSNNQQNLLQHNIGDIKEDGYQLAEGFIEQNEQNETTEKNLNFNDQIHIVEEKNPYESFDDTDFSDDEAQVNCNQHFEASTETKEGTCNDSNTPAVIKSKDIKEECAYAVVNKTK